MYTNVKLSVSEGQKDRIEKALESGTGVSLRFAYEDLSNESEYVLALTKSQINKITKAYQNGIGVTINMSKAQLKHNMKVEGGFLPAILGFLASTVAPFLLKTALPALATGALSGLASTGVSKVMGSAIYIKRGGITAKITPTGNGLHLSPWNKGSSVTGDGLYMKTGASTYANGEGLILGPDSPFKNIPILGLLL